MKDNVSRMRSKWPLLALFALAFCALFAETIELFGLPGVAPQYGYWDAVKFPTTAPYSFELAPRASGASAQAGARSGDRFDLRDNDLETRSHFLWQPVVGKPEHVVVRRNSLPVAFTVVPTSVYDGQPAWKLPSPILSRLTGFFLLACALLIALRRSDAAEARALAAIMLLWVLSIALAPGGIGIAWGWRGLTLVELVVSRAVAFGSSLLIVLLAARFGTRSAWRRWLEWFAIAAIAARFADQAALAYAVLTLRIDPAPHFDGTLWLVLNTLSFAAVSAAAIAATATSEPSQRPRVAWILLPIPIALAVASVMGGASLVQKSWFAFITYIAAANVATLVGALLVTYALLRRRVLDVGFVVSRSIVFAIVSLLVVSAFVLLEWLLGSVLAGAGHVTGVVANAGLALVLGVSMRYIHKRVDEFVDTVMFRKRHDDERALRDFSKEAAFVTKPDVLFDQTIGLLRAHTDARATAIFVRNGESYANAAGFGDLPAHVDENDPAILALKAWHKPLDPNAYATALAGDLALPMVGRGQLVGVLLCGERTGGEAYAPDEIDALAELARGVGSAYDGLAFANGAAGDEMLATMRAVRSLLAKLTSPNAGTA